MLKTAKKRAHVPRPRLARYRVDRALTQAAAPALPESIWQIIGQLLVRTAPIHALKLAMTCRATRDSITGDDQLWMEVLRAREADAWARAGRTRGYRPLRHQPLTNVVTLSAPPDFLDEAPHRIWLPRVPVRDLLARIADDALDPGQRAALARHCRRAVAVADGLRCGLCGARYHHHPLWSLGLRACDVCLKDRLVSGAALYQDYGIDFTRHAAALTSGVYFFLCARLDTFVQAHLSNNPADFDRPGAKNRNPRVFFWRDHLARVFDLPAAAARQRRARAEAAPRLTAAVRALHARLLVGHQGHALKPISSHCFYTLGSESWRREGHAAHLTQFCGPAPSDRTAAARAELQRLFLAYDARLVPTRARNPARTADMLRQHEGSRCARLAARYEPFVYAITGADGCGVRFRGAEQQQLDP